jgi:outer membrane protein assembly factor BamD
MRSRVFFQHRSAVAVLLSAALSAMLLSGCSSTPKNQDDNKTAQQLYEEAREEASSGAYERAQKLFEKLEGVAAGTLISQQAQLEQAYLQYRQRESAQALATLERFLRLHPTSPAADYAYYLQGLVNFNDDLGLFGTWARVDLSERDQQASKDAYQSFKTLVDRYPESKYAADAQTRMNYIVNSLAGYEVHVARYYYKRGAYLAAANRAQQAVQDFRSSPSTEEALFLMMASYNKMGLNQLRDDAQRVLKQNFPKSAWLAQGFEYGGKSWWSFF